MILIKKEELANEFIGFTIGHPTARLNGLCVYKGVKTGRIYFKNDMRGIQKQYYVGTHEMILPAKRLVILLIYLLKDCRAREL